MKGKREDERRKGRREGKRDRSMELLQFKKSERRASPITYELCDHKQVT